MADEKQDFRNHIQAVADMIWDREISSGKDTLIRMLIKTSDKTVEEAAASIKRYRMEELIEAVNLYCRDEHAKQMTILAVGGNAESIVNRCIVLALLEYLVKPLVAENKMLTLALQNKEEAAHD
ncbi:MAG: hypothetical protein IJT52_03740 [Spirochaetales bacterium]|nr:hypothetical protein [Spirochaetales bacterium]